MSFKQSGFVPELCGSSRPGSARCLHQNGPQPRLITGTVSVRRGNADKALQRLTSRYHAWVQYDNLCRHLQRRDA